MLRRAQAGTEAVIIFSILFLIFVIFQLYLVQKSKQTKEINVETEASRVIGLVADKINLAVKNGRGYVTKVDLPKKLVTKQYEILIYPRERRIAIHWNSYKIYRSLLTSDINGSFEPGESKLIENTGEGIVIR